MADYSHPERDGGAQRRPSAEAPVSARGASLSELGKGGTLDAELRLIAEQAQMLTGASGAAIALREGELMVCRARAGNTAPPLGAPLDTRSGLSGECVRSARTLLCDDTESDPRVNLDVCRDLGIRSVAVLPIGIDREIIGVLEAFSPHPRAFSQSQVAALESMCDLVISVARPVPAEADPSASLLRTMLAARAAGNVPPDGSRVQANSPATWDPEDDLLCEIEQRAQQRGAPQPMQVLEPRLAPGDPDDLLLCEIEQPAKPPAQFSGRAFEMIEGGRRRTPVAPATESPIRNADPEDDLICEIEERRRQEQVGRPAQPSAPTLTAFNPAPAALREQTISRKLIVAGIITVVLGVIWLGWCNRTGQQATNSDTTGSVIEAAPPEPPPNAQPWTAVSDAAAEVSQPGNELVRLLRRAANSGNAEAELALAVRYTNGDGVNQSYPEALKWFRRAQAQGLIAPEGEAAEAWHIIKQWAQPSPPKQ